MGRSRPSREPTWAQEVTAAQEVAAVAAQAVAAQAVQMVAAQRSALALVRVAWLVSSSANMLATNHLCVAVVAIAGASGL